MFPEIFPLSHTGLQALLSKRPASLAGGRARQRAHERGVDGLAAGGGVAARRVPLAVLPHRLHRPLRAPQLWYEQSGTNVLYTSNLNKLHLNRDFSIYNLTKNWFEWKEERIWIHNCFTRNIVQKYRC